MFSTIDLCLLCLTNNKTLKSILSQDSEGILIEEKYRFVFNESIKIKPEVSYHTCLQCLKNLNDAYNFKQIGLQNISKFNNYVDTLDNNKYLKVTLTNLQNQKKIQLTYNNESANEISSPTEVVRIKEEIAGDCVMQEEEAMYEDDEFSALEKPENMSDNVKYRSSLCEESHIENFLKNETEMEIIPKEFHIKDEQLFEAIEDNWNDKLQNEETNTPDEFSALETQENMSDNVKSRSSLCEESHIENFLKNETEMKIIPEELHIKDEQLFEATEDKWNDKLQNEETNTPDCNSTFVGDEIDEIDYQNLDSGKRYKCEFCQEAFPWSSHLERHRNSHIREQLFKCSNCSKSFARLDSFITHKRTHTNNIHACNVCGKTFTRRASYTKHMQTHTEDKSYHCSGYQHVFTKASSLKKHAMRMHTSLKCSVCQNTFSHRARLIEHMRIHTGEKPHHCEVCQYKFARADSLKRHMRIHSSTYVPSVKCSVCQNTFSHRARLIEHMRIHTGEKPYHCEVCQYKFARADSLKRHMRVHTGEKSFTCNHCHRVFRHLNGLQKHINTQHSTID